MKVTIVLGILFVNYILAVQSNFPLGANLTPPSVFGSDPVFVDAMRQGNIGPLTNPFGTGLSVDANGWPTTDFGAAIVSPLEGGQEMVGDWYISWIGNATISWFWTSVTILNVTYDPVTKIGSAWVNLSPSSPGLFLNFDTNNHGVKNVSAIRPGYDIHNYPTFTNTYINTLQKLPLNTYRFMDWAQTNGNPVSKWSDRWSPTNFRPQNGIPWEWAIELANLMKVNMWVNVPHMADDDYVLQMAKLFKELLDPSLAVYVEYSNELWNWSFIQFGWNHDQAVAMVTNGTYGPVLNYDNIDNEWFWTYRRTAWRAMTISNIWREAWGDCAMNNEVRIVLAGLIAGAGIAETGLDMINTIYGPPNQYFYAVAGAPYYQLGDTTNDTLTTDDIIRMLKTVSESLPTAFGYLENMGFARYYGLKFLAYEGGPDTFGPNSISAKKNASGDPRMINITFNYLEAWYANGGDLFNWFNFISGTWDSQYGTWSVTDDIMNLTTPKILGIEKVIKTPLPPVTAGHILPTTISGLSGFNGSPGTWFFHNYGDRNLFTVNDRHTYGGIYNLYFNYTAYIDTSIAIYLNNEVQNYNFTLSPAENGLSEPFEITIPAGLQTVGIFSRYSGDYVAGINSLQFQFVSELTQAIPVEGNCTHVDVTTGTSTGMSSTSGNSNQDSVNSASTFTLNVIALIAFVLIESLLL